MQVLNRHTHGIPGDAVYVGRPSEFGNPFTVKEYGRGKCIELYRERIMAQPKLLAMIRKQLKGKYLVGSCAPLPCHADVLMELANPGFDKATHVPF